MIEVHEVAGLWSIADGGGWCEGIYDSEKTARYAHRHLGAMGMGYMWAAHSAKHEAPYPPMTEAEVRAWLVSNE